MGVPDWIVLALVAAAAGAALRTWRKSGACSCGGKHPGSSGCGGCCGGCSGCAACAARHTQKK